MGQEDKTTRGWKGRKETWALHESGSCLLNRDARIFAFINHLSSRNQHSLVLNCEQLLRTKAFPSYLWQISVSDYAVALRHAKSPAA
jgi:hypothetical protein